MVGSCKLHKNNSEIWYIPTLKVTLKQRFLSASAKALRVCERHFDYGQSFENLHRISLSAVPESILRYKMSLCLYKLHNNNFNSIEFALLNSNQILTSRQTTLSHQRVTFLKWELIPLRIDWPIKITKYPFLGSIC